MKTNWKEVNWIVDIDIRKAFDNITHNILFNELQEVIGDQRVVDELRRMMKAGSMGKDGV